MSEVVQLNSLMYMRSHIVPEKHAAVNGTDVWNPTRVANFKVGPVDLSELQLIFGLQRSIPLEEMDALHGGLLYYGYNKVTNSGVDRASPVPVRSFPRLQSSSPILQKFPSLQLATLIQPMVWRR